jgi:hypothetical protein
MFVKANPNPCNQRVGDCVIRALCIANDDTWEETYRDLTRKGFIMCDMPSSNNVWSAYLEDLGWKREMIPNNNYTIKDFCRDHRNGTYILATGSHVVAVIDGDYFDTWDSGQEVPIFYFWR